MKFTWNYDFHTGSVNFLDLTIWADDGGYIQTDLFIKPNMKNQYLLPASCHPSHICRNIPYSLAHRSKRICSKESDFTKRLGELKVKLRERSYRNGVIEAAFAKAMALDRNKTLEKVERKKVTCDRCRFVIRFDPRLKSISSILKEELGNYGNR